MYTNSKVVVTGKEYMHQRYTWKGLSEASTEELLLTQTEAGIEAVGTIAGTNGQDVPFELRYSIEMSPEWLVQHVIVHNERIEGVEVDLRRENGQWRDVMGHVIQHVDDVLLIDIASTPFTNTLAIKYLNLALGETKTVPVLYIPSDDFKVRLSEQTYTRLGQHTYRFTDSQLPEFQADIILDDDDIVLVYPGLFLRKEL